MRVLLVTAPLVQLNTPYPATPYLTGFLRTQAGPLGVEVHQADPGLELFLRLYSRQGLTAVRDTLAATRRDRLAAPRAPRSVALASFVDQAQRYVDTVDAAIRFLQGRDPSLAARIAARGFLPEGPRFAALDTPDHDENGPLGWAFGALGVADRAKHIASLYVDDLADAIRDGVDPHFGLSRYGERLAASAGRFDPIAAALAEPRTLVARIIEEIAADLVRRHDPDLVGVSVPFPGNLYGAFLIAQAVRRSSPRARLVLGGGYVNTELRGLAEPRVFDSFDYVTLDDGERPLLRLIERLRAERSGGATPAPPFVRTFVRRGGQVTLENDAAARDVSHAHTGTPTYDGLPLERYVSLVEMLNPMHRLWSDGRWNKLTLAHGCYWRKCTFCDISLDYIGRYEPASADLLVDRIVALCAETGQSGFHFVDEAAPPALLRALAERLIARNVVISWWGNIRFEKTFTPALTSLLARSGCIAVSGGLEVASDRLLRLMEKGVTVAQVARVTRAFTEAGVMVHAYLMYGFPTETEQETIDALERVRQLFAAGCIQSAFWHRFAATVHSPIAMNPKRFGIRIVGEGEGGGFARNEVPFDDPTGTDHDFLGEGLRKALYNYMHGVGLELDVRRWFPRRGRRRAVPAPQVPPDLILNALGTP